MQPNSTVERLVLIEANVQFLIHAHGTSDENILEEFKSMNQRELRMHLLSSANIELVEPHAYEIVGEYVGNGNYADAKTNDQI